MSENARAFSRIRHPFLVEVIMPTNGESHINRVFARVRQATRPVTITLTAAHVEKSMKLKGAGNTATCAMAVCAVAHKDAFPHPVEGYIDWTYSRAYVVSKTKQGLPTECVAYEHSDDIAKLNDTRGGQRKLLKLLQESGDMTIALRPYRKRSEIGRSGEARVKTGVRQKLAAAGANLRYAVWKLGAYPQPPKS